jgi:hypothetical protein
MFTFHVHRITILRAIPLSHLNGDLNTSVGQPKNAIESPYTQNQVRHFKHEQLNTEARRSQGVMDWNGL